MPFSIPFNGKSLSLFLRPSDVCSWERVRGWEGLRRKMLCKRCHCEWHQVSE